jgi:hypothetical protein
MTRRLARSRGARPASGLIALRLDKALTLYEAWPPEYSGSSLNCRASISKDLSRRISFVESLLAQSVGITYTGKQPTLKEV